MRILHLTKFTKKKYISEKIAEDLGINYIKQNLKDWHEFYCEDIILVIVDYYEQIESEEVIKFFNIKSHGLIPCIILGNEIDFSKKKNLYYLGASSVFPSLDEYKEEIKNIFHFALKQKEILLELKNKKIAVIDDSRLSLEIIKDYFKKANIKNAKFFNDPEVFLPSFTDFDIYIIDLVMPHFMGQELIQLIKRNNKEAVILTITTYGEGSAIPQSLSIGASDFLIKPFSFKLFILRLIGSLQKKLLKIEKNKSQSKLYDLANKDHLTELFNRRYFVKYFEKEVNNFNETKEPFSVILLDLDYFKLINDEYGHQEGDRVLKEISKYLINSLRKTDIVSRWGGEEFIISLPKTSLEEGNQIAENLREGIAKLDIKGIKHITASFGVASMTLEDTKDTIFKRVDNSLYLAKFTGRNRVVSNEKLNIHNGDFPVNIEWGAFFRSGNSEIDEEHNCLIDLSNNIILHAFNKENRDKVSKLFVELVEDIKKHFKNEEDILENYNYDDLLEHKKTHDDLIEKTKNMMKRFEKKEIDSLDVAKYVIQEVVVGHIVKSDFDYYDLFSKNKN